MAESRHCRTDRGHATFASRAMTANTAAVSAKRIVRKVSGSA